MNNGGEVKLRVVQKSPSSYFEVCTNDTDSGENKTGKTLVLSMWAKPFGEGKYMGRLNFTLLVGSE